MCHRVSPLTHDEAQMALSELYSTGHARVPKRDALEHVPDAYPGKQLPLFVLGENGRLEVAELLWGFANPLGAQAKTVFNTRIETALSQVESGEGMWSKAIQHGRCLVPVRGFYEWTTKAAHEQRMQVRFTLPGHHVFLLAGIYEGERFSVVTTRPNASVAPVHTRMPLVLAPGESATWLSPSYASLANRSHVTLEAATLPA